MRSLIEGTKFQDIILEYGIRHRPLVMTMTGDLTLTTKSPQMLFLDPNGSDRVVTLPAVTMGLEFSVFNTGTANKITVKNASAVTIGLVGVSGFKRVVSSRAAWTSTSAEAATGTFGAYGVTPVVQPSGATQNAITDSSGGTASDTIAADSAYQVFGVRLTAASLANAQEYQFDPKFAGSFISINARALEAITTGAKAATVTARVNAGAVGGGGVVALAGTYAIGAAQAGSAITGAAQFTAAQTFGFTVGSVTTFVEGAFTIECTLRNDSLAAAAAKWSAMLNKLRTDLVALGFWKGSA